MSDDKKRKNINDKKRSKEATKKPTLKKKFSMDDFKKSHLNATTSIKDKPLEWYKLSDAIKEVVGLDGFPKGYTSLCSGYSNTGKSTAVSEGIVDAQKQGDFVIIIDTETSIGPKRLIHMGFDVDDVDSYLYVMPDTLYQEYKNNKEYKDLNTATIEHMAKYINHMIDLQQSGALPFNVLIAIDSIGALDCILTVRGNEGETQNNMWNAGAYERKFKGILNGRVPATRKEGSEYFLTVIAVQKVWFDSTVGGQGTLRYKGGNAFHYGSRLIYQFGNDKTTGARRVTAETMKRKITYGVDVPVKITKNQIDGVGGIAYEGRIISTPHGFILNTTESIKEYKKDNFEFFRDILGDEIDNAEFKVEDREISIDKIEKGEDFNEINDILDNMDK